MKTRDNKLLSFDSMFMKLSYNKLTLKRIAKKKKNYIVVILAMFSRKFIPRHLLKRKKKMSTKTHTQNFIMGYFVTVKQW